ncbi:2-amino-4-hydroxy-6-hydroxymethyldihydropteridine diphosphokinase [Vibrio hannami]|uniref:2-amino-4-hydroxy-6- hydroxymethyldihydropteridine diphosphokinase n=1 Tax=Vibrio hannami TaxID=2717094 RepID=UPI00240FEA2B|nr:2-amino-4-hydroxy-6-hydroxymethyldihydropteridine diphosphokinase [Vibrio hannami]MDG3089098.1 2-amino-4-hydroxy-6-hydroxymethyldihydropteridine diphosphokinase [Vibrio hannami]
MTTAYIGVGTNIEREKHTRAAIEELSKLDSALRVSPIYECKAVGFGGSAFYNFVIELNTSLTLTEFSQKLRKIELKWGRKENAQKYQDRTLDLDIILFGKQISKANPIVPRDDIYKYPFVIQPLCDLAPGLVLPESGDKVCDIWAQMDGLDSLTVLDFYFNGVL